MKLKNIFKTGLSFGIAITILFILQKLLDNEELTSTEIIKLVVEGISTVIFASFLYGLLMSAFIKSKFVKNTTKISTQPDETILFETPANHFKSIEAVGGKLYLTNQRLIFQSHKLNIQNHQLSINLNDIDNVHRYKTLGMIDNGLSITTNNSTTKNFVVEQPAKWIEMLLDKKLHAAENITA
jgi:hypothetical protein